jgi:hypothetical protein
MQNSTSMLFSYSLIIITVFLATLIIQTVTSSNISAQQNNLNPLTISFTTTYYSIPNAAAEDDEDEDDIAEHNRNADKKHD